MSLIIKFLRFLQIVILSYGFLEGEVIGSEIDTLANGDFDNLTIQQSLTVNNLSVRSSILNKIGIPSGNYTIENNIFSLQNVSGKRMRCFFNAVGLEPDKVIIQLTSKQNDPIVRYMIANEIVSALDTPNQIPQSIKDCINFTLYETQLNAINNQEEQRSRALSNQSSNPNQQDISKLPEVLQSIEKRKAENIKDLRKRALSLNTFKAFLEDHIKNEEMMVALHDVKGEEGDNNLGNFTSLDAIAYAHNFGLRIYQPNPLNQLHLVHQFIPQNATEIAYLYHEGIHFQSLILKDSHKVLTLNSRNFINPQMDVNDKENLRKSQILKPKEFSKQPDTFPNVLALEKEKIIKEQLEEDLKKLKKLSITIKILLKRNFEKDEFLQYIEQLGIGLKSLSWNTKNPDNIRNKHGYRNRYEKKGYERNATGAKIDFEILQHLSLLTKEKWKSFLTSHEELIKRSLAVLDEKINFIISNQQTTSSTSDIKKANAHEREIGALVKLCAFAHDVECLEKMENFLELLMSENVKKLDYSKLENRYCLGYLFVQFGETAKELSEYIKREHHKKGEKNLLRHLFTQIGKYRQSVKNEPWVIYDNNSPLIQMYNKLIIYSSDLKLLLKELRTALDNLISSSENEGINFKEALHNIDTFYDLKGASFFEEKIKGLIDLEALSFIFGKNKGSKVSNQEELEKKFLELKNLEKDTNSIDEKLRNLKESEEKVIDESSRTSQNITLDEVKKMTCETSNAKQFLSLYDSLKEKYLQNTTDPLAEPAKFEQELKALQNNQDIALTDRKKIGALIAISIKYVGALKNCVANANKNNALSLPTDNLQDLIKYCEGGAVSAVSSKQKLMNEREKFEKQINALEKEIKRIKEIQKISDAFNTKKKSMINMLIPKTYKNDDSNQANDLQVKKTPAHRLVENILAVYKLLERLADQNIPDFVKKNATKMAIGFLGQYYKDFFETKDSLDEVFIKDSPLVNSMMYTKRVRDQIIMHNSKNQGGYDASDTLYEHVSPWETDINYLNRYFISKNLDFSLFLRLLPEQQKKRIEAAEYTEVEQKVVLINKHMSALLRFINPDQVIKFQQEHLKILDDKGIRPELIIKNKSYLTKAYYLKGDKISLERSLLLLKEVELFIKNLSDLEQRKKYMHKNQMTRVGVLLHLQDYEKSSSLVLDLLEEIDDEEKSILHMMLSEFKRHENYQEGINHILDAMKLRLESLSYGDLFVYSQLVSAQYTTHGDYETATLLINFMDGVLKGGESLFKNSVGQSYEGLLGNLSYQKGTLWHHQGVSTGNINLIRQSTDEYTKQLNFLMRTQPDSEFTRRMHYRIGRNLLFSENSFDKAAEYFNKCGEFFFEPLDNKEWGYEDQIIRELLLIDMFNDYIFHFIVPEKFEEYSPDLYALIKKHQTHDLSKNMIEVVTFLENHYINIAYHFIYHKQWEETKDALKKSSLSSHIIRFFQRAFLDVSQRNVSNSEDEIQEIIETFIVFSQMDIGDLFKEIEEYCQKKSRSPLSLMKNFTPERFLSSIADVVSLYYDKESNQKSSLPNIQQVLRQVMGNMPKAYPTKLHYEKEKGQEAETQIIRQVTKILMKQYSYTMPSKNILINLNEKEVQAILKKGLIESFFHKIHNIIELRHPNNIYPFWYLMKSGEISLTQRLDNPWRRFGLIWGAKFLQAIDAGILTDSSSAKQISDFLLDDQYESRCISRINPKYDDDIYRDMCSLIDYVEYLNKKPMHDENTLFFPSTPNSNNPQSPQDPKESSNNVAYKNGLLLMEEKKYKEAVNYFRSYLMRHKNNAEAMHQLSLAYAGLGRVKDAEKWFKKAIKSGYNPSKYV